MKKVYWKNIPGYEGLYEASNYGDIKSLKFGKERILKKTLTKNNYYMVGLMKDGKPNFLLVHQLISMAFLGHIPNGNTMVVDHKDLDGTNNYIGTPENNYEDGNLHIVPHRDNLSICTRKNKYNKSSLLDGVSWNKKSKKWKSQFQYKGKIYHLGYYNTQDEAHLKWKEAYEADKNGKFEIFNLQFKRLNKSGINQYTKSGEFIREWKSSTEAGKELNIFQQNICNCCIGRSKSAGGYVWEYASDCK